MSNLAVGALRQSGNLFALGLDVVRSLPRRPFQTKEFIQQGWFLASVTILPTALVSIPFGAVIALQLGNLTRQLGAQSFTGSASVLAVIREARPIVTALLIAGAPAEPAWDGRDRPARQVTRPAPLLLVAGLVVVVLLVTAGLLTVRARGADRVEQARTEATAAAEATAVNLLSYDYRHLDRDFARAGLTGGFADDYATTTETVVRPTATEVEAVVKADVAASSVVRADRSTVVVLLFVNQTTSSTRLDAPKVDLNRVRLTMERVHDRWLVSTVVAL